MLTPSFQISQTDEILFIEIKTPYIQLKSIDCETYGSTFWFYASPYYLRLTLPYEVMSTDEPEMEYDADTSVIEVTIRKKNPGQHFPDLDLLGILLLPQKQKNLKPSIEVISGDCETEVETESEEGEEEEEEEDSDEWLIHQEIPVSPSYLVGLLNAPRYGFGNQTKSVFLQLKSEFNEIIDLPDPDLTLASQREELMRAEENEKFCSDHYLADFMESEVVQEYFTYKTSWETETPDTVKLTEEEQEVLKTIGNKDFLLRKEDKIAAWLSLVDIVFAYAYNHRTTLGENTVESAWTINKLSSTLSWFTTYTSMKSVVISCFRRLLTYSLCRNWDLAQLVLKDTIAILKLGRRQVLKCLLEIHSLFNKSEPRYLLNQLYITDYCIWLQKRSEDKLAKFTDTLEKVLIVKRNVEFDLEELEQAALLVQMEEKEDGLSKKMQKLNLDKSNGIRSSSSSSGDNTTSLDSDDASSPEN